MSVGYTWILHGRGINTYAKHVCWRRRDRGINTYAKHVCWRRRDAGMNHLKKYQLQKGMKSVGFHALVKIPFYLLRMNAAMMLSIPKRIKYAATK